MDRMSPEKDPPSTSSTTTSTTTSTSCTPELSRSSSLVSDLPATSSPSGDSPPLELRSTESMCHHCFDVLVHALHQQNNNNHNNNRNNKGSYSCSLNSLTSAFPEFASSLVKPEFIDHLPPGELECPLFVTWDKRRHHQSSSLLSSHSQQQQHKFELRGCIGTHSPKPLLTSIGEYALISAFKDKRFRPVTIAELPFLRVAVSLLIRYEPCEHCHDWTVGVHGVIIGWTDGNNSDTAAGGRGALGGGREYSATYLPEVAADQGWDQATAIESLIRKAGFRGRITPTLLQQLQCTRYQSSKSRVTFDEYLQVRSGGGVGAGAGAVVGGNGGNDIDNINNNNDNTSALWMMIVAQAVAANDDNIDGTTPSRNNESGGSFSFRNHRGDNSTTDNVHHPRDGSSSSNCVIS